VRASRTSTVDPFASASSAARCRLARNGPARVERVAQPGIVHSGGGVEVVLDGDDGAAGVTGKVADGPDPEPRLSPPVGGHRGDDVDERSGRVAEALADGGGIGTRHTRTSSRGPATSNRDLCPLIVIILLE
jgi:hypothetical protein